jgi:hypothetical protein
MWGRGGYFFKAGMGMSRYYGIPAGYSPSNGTSYVPPEKTGGMFTRSIIGIGVASDVPLTGKGILETTIDGIGNLFFANLAGGKYGEATIEGIGDIIAGLIAKGHIACEVSIGSRPSAEDIIYALMDTPVGNIESYISFRDAMKRILGISKGKVNR